MSDIPDPAFAAVSLITHREAWSYARPGAAIGLSPIPAHARRPRSSRGKETGTKMSSALRGLALLFRSDATNRRALMYTAASLVASAVNCLYYPAMGHLVRVEEYGELQVILAFVVQLNTITIGLSIVNVNLIANNDGTEGVSLVIALQRAAFWTAVAVSVVLCGTAGWLKAYFHFASSWPFLLIVPILLVQVVSSFWTGYLQGRRDFVGVFAYGLSIGAGKLLFSAALVAAGLSLLGGIAGFILALLFGLAVTRYAARHPPPRLRQALAWPNAGEWRAVRRHLAYVTEVVVTIFAMSLLLSVDTLLVKHLFPSRFAGRYAGAATTARIIFFAAAPLVTVMLPSISLADRPGARRVFRHTMAITVAICAIGVGCAALFAGPILAILLGGEFVPCASWLAPLGLVASAATVTNVMLNYLLALRSHAAVVVGLTSLVVAAPLILTFHATVLQIVGSTSAGLLAGHVVFCVVFFLDGRSVLRPPADGPHIAEPTPARPISRAGADRHS